MGERPVLLISLDWSRPGDSRRSLGSASIVAALRAEDMQVSWLEASVNHEDFDLQCFLGSILETVDQLGPDLLVGIGCYIWNDPQVEIVLAALRVRDVEVVLGGPQISFTKAGDLAHRYPGVAYFVRGYGEQAMLDLALGTAEHGVHGLFVADLEDHGRSFDGELDSLPSPYLTGVLPAEGEVRWETQRGCPFRCSFCQHRDPNRKHKPRTLGVDRLSAELELFAAAGTKRISILDPIFHTDRSRAIAILHKARELGIQATFSLQCRFEMLHPDFLAALEGLDVTLEFGLQTIHEAEGRAVRRQNRMERVERALAEVQRRGIDFEISLIFGLPNQTLESFRASVDWCIARQVPRVRAWPLMLLRGTPLFEERARWGFVETDGPIPEVVSSNSFTVEENQEMRALAAWLNDMDAGEPVAAK